MGYKRGPIGNTLEQHIENLGNITGNMWEHTENMVGTHNPKEGKPSLMQILFPKVIRYHIFGMN
jgi:hypothetical protein